LVWTTTPWTLPSNYALCVNSDIDYVLVETEEIELIEKSEKTEKSDNQKCKYIYFHQNIYIKIIDKIIFNYS
jgi:isoleucyl-tRNA synthetase